MRLTGTGYFSSCGGSGSPMLKREVQAEAGKGTARITSTAASDRPFSPTPPPPPPTHPPIPPPQFQGLDGQEKSDKRLPRWRGAPRGLPALPGKGKAGSRGMAGEGPGNRHPHLLFSLGVVRDRPPGRVIGRWPPCYRAPRGREVRWGIPRAVPAALGRSKRVISVPTHPHPDPPPFPSPPCRGTRRSSRLVRPCR